MLQMGPLLNLERLLHLNFWQGNGLFFSFFMHATSKRKSLRCIQALCFLLGNYTLNSPGGHSASGFFGSGLNNGHGGHSFLNGGASMANLGLMTSTTHMPQANMHSQSPTTVLSNYSLNRNLNQLNLNLVPRTNR